jgi:hypothetical protein
MRTIAIILAALIAQPVFSADKKGRQERPLSFYQDQGSHMGFRSQQRLSSVL